MPRISHCQSISNHHWAKLKLCLVLRLSNYRLKTTIIKYMINTCNYGLQAKLFDQTLNNEEFIIFLLIFVKIII